MSEEYWRPPLPRSLMFPGLPGKSNVKFVLSITHGLSYTRYADVEHAVQRITSGHRLVLTYNWFNQAAGESRCAASLENDKQIVVGAL